MNRHTLRRGFARHEEAQAFAKSLPANAAAKVVPYSTGRFTHAFAVDVDRHYSPEECPMENKIICESLPQFAKLCALFQREGLAFNADAAMLRITVTGY